MGRSMKNFAERILINTMGTSVVELALIFPIFLLIMAGFSDFASAFTVKLQTQQAAARTMELATTAGIEAVSLDRLRAEAASGAKVSVSNVTAEQWLECAGTKQPSFEGSCAPGEETARFVSVRISNDYRPKFGRILPQKVAPNGSITFTGYSNVRMQ